MTLSNRSEKLWDQWQRLTEDYVPPNPREQLPTIVATYSVESVVKEVRPHFLLFSAVLDLCAVHTLVGKGLRSRAYGRRSCVQANRRGSPKLLP
jgi:hypothetical protein